MKGLFIFDQALAVSTEGNIYDSIFTNEVFKRYLSHVEQLTIIVRLRPADMNIIEKRNIPQIDLENIRVVNIPNLLSVKGMMKYYKARKIVCAEVKKADIIFVREPSVLEGIATYYAKKMKKKYILELGGCPWDTFWNQGFKGKIVAPIRYWSTRRATWNAEHVVYVTNQWLQHRYPTQGRSVCCSNVNIECDEASLTKRLKKIRKKTEKRVIIGSIGDYDVRSKGHRYIIQALALLNCDDEKYIYQIVGSGDKTDSLEIAKKYNVDQYIEFVPPMNHADILKWLDQIDIYAQPSRQEGLPRSVIEAMSRGLAVIGARTGGIPELIRDECVFSNSKDEVNEIVDIIKKLDDKGKLIELAVENYNNSMQYNSSIIEKRRSDFFDEVIRS